MFVFLLKKKVLLNFALNHRKKVIDNNNNSLLTHLAWSVTMKNAGNRNHIVKCRTKTGFIIVRQGGI